LSRKYFGTDGVRGKAGTFPLDRRTVYALGRAAGLKLGGQGASALLAMDPRESSGWISALILEGLRREGVECHYAGVLPTPAVARLCLSRGYSFGVMISASHNPYSDNGIKFFSGDGFKLPDAAEKGIEEALEEVLPLTPENPEAPEPRLEAEECQEEYLEWLVSWWSGPSLAGRKVIVDAANGAASRVAPELLRMLGADVVPHACRPDGRNINALCGSLHPEQLAARVVEEAADMGFAFDGDADRCLTVAPSGQVLDGDYVLYRDGLKRHAGGHLPGGWIVGTVMSNLWLEKALSKAGLKFFRAPVGDRYVLENLLERGGVLGGEPSGHILFLDQATTGDGLLTAIAYARLAQEAGGVQALAEGIRPYPQVLKNIRVARRVPLEDVKEIQDALLKERAGLDEAGRIVLRYSGTEPLLRIMVEAETQEAVDGVVKRLTKVLVGALGEA
jgi:phosphoglucosamine mutase